ncbi:hypothetical protein JCM10207_001162 [Rhodosporidiobolus poonsookiae]
MTSSAAAGLPPRPTPEITPQDLAAQFKKDGHFDSLRRDLLASFLSSPDRDALSSRLDAVLPTLLASSPSIARHQRKDRPAAVLAELEKRGVLRESAGRLEGRLRAKKGKGKRVERELGRTLRRARGETVEDEEAGEDEESEEELEKPVTAVEAPAAALPTNGLTPAAPHLAHPTSDPSSLPAAIVDAASAPAAEPTLAEAEPSAAPAEAAEEAATGRKEDLAALEAVKTENGDVEMADESVAADDTVKEEPQTA